MRVVFKTDDWNVTIEEHHVESEEKVKKCCEIQISSANTEKDIPEGVSAIFKNCKFYK